MHILDRARTLGVDDKAGNAVTPGSNASIRRAIQAEGAIAFESGNFGRAEALAVLYRHVCHWCHPERKDRRSKAIIPYTGRDGTARYMEMYDCDGVAGEATEVFREMQASEA